MKELTHLLVLLMWYPFKNKAMRELQIELIEHIRNLITPKLTGDFECVEVYIDEPHVHTIHKTHEEAMNKIQAAQRTKKDSLYAAHILRSGTRIYTWEKGQANK